MISSNYDWQLVTETADKEFLKVAKKEGLDRLAANLLFARGIQSVESLQAFLHPSLDDLHDPYLLHDMKRAVERIFCAIEKSEKILIYGDYDADGMTSAAILKETLEELGAECQVYLPNRFTDGYGPNTSVYKYFIEQQSVSLIVTVDNGVAGHEAIFYAQSVGVDVIVTDHHSMPDDLPNAYAIIHPEHPEADYPFQHLAGCGVAFKLACALLDTVQVELLDLVAIGTIADMVSLTDENRIMVKYGLSLLRQSERVGLQELMKIADIEMENLDEETVGFQIAPRLNALGRLDDPNPAIELLTGFDDEIAGETAEMIDKKNMERKDIVQAIYDEAKLMVDPNKPAQVLAKEGWNTGVLGIVAGRLLEELGQPVVVLNIEDGKARGSARSIETINIFEALTEHRDIFLAFGGHAGAAGMTLSVEHLPTLSDILSTYIAEHQIDQTVKPPLVLDEELDLEELTLDTLKSLDKLKPYGMGYSKPIFYIKNFQVESARTMGQNNAHLKFRISKGKAECDVVAFGKGHLVTEFSQAKKMELAASLCVNHWNGHTGLQLLLEDARINGVQLYNIRGKNTALPSGVPVLDLRQELPDISHQPAIVIDHLTEDPSILKKIFQSHSFEAVYFKNTMDQPYYLDGYGSREQFAKLYKTLYQFPEFDVRYKLGELSQFLKIKQPLLVKMIQIFQELGFVSIKDGVMTINKSAEKREIAESQIYQDFKELVLYQEKMALGTVQEIYDWLIEK